MKSTLFWIYSMRVCQEVFFSFVRKCVSRSKCGLFAELWIDRADRADDASFSSQAQTRIGLKLRSSYGEWFSCSFLGISLSMLFAINLKFSVIPQFGCPNHRFVLREHLTGIQFARQMQLFIQEREWMCLNSFRWRAPLQHHWNLKKKKKEKNFCLRNMCDKERKYCISNRSERSEMSNKNAKLGWMISFRLHMMLKWRPESLMLAAAGARKNGLVKCMESKLFISS